MAVGEYPIARGTAPLVVTMLAAVFVGETLDGAQAAGVTVCCAGLVGAAIGAVFFRERFGLPRIAAAGLMLAGIGLTLHTGQ